MESLVAPYRDAQSPFGEAWQPFWVKDFALKVCEEKLTLPVSNADAFPAKKAGIDRPGTWSEHG
jgi:hypothetical protein